jgi:lambda repressor-like predicted transcriptional regulator
MTVYSVTAGLQPAALSVASSPVGELRTTVLSAVAGTLNTSVADVQGRLRGGQTLADLARTAGLSRDQLVATINAAVSASGRVSTDLDVDQVVHRIADQRKKTERTSPAPQRTGGRSPDHGTGSQGRLLDVEL